MFPVDARKRLLIVDDSADTRELLERNLASREYEVLTAADVAEAMKILDSARVDLVITDLKMPGTSGMDLVRYVRENIQDTEVMVITGYPSVEGAVAAVKSGAEEYLTKPFTKEELSAAVGRALEKLSGRKGSRARGEPLRGGAYGIVGESRAMQTVFEAVRRTASGTAPVLITGESGTGKGLVARAIHCAGPRAAAPFVAVQCGAAAEESLEKDLFGYADSGSPAETDSRDGLFQFARGGTLFLEAVPDMGYVMQTRLLQVLENKAFTVVGSTRSVPFDARILTASDKDLCVLVGKGTFREDLYHRLSMSIIAVPPLRDREEDIVLLAVHFLRKFSKELGRPTPVFSEPVQEIMKNYPWPGNLRELQNFAQRLALTAEGSTIEPEDCPGPMRLSVSRGAGLNRSLAQIEAEHIRSVLAAVDGNKTRAAEILGINRKTLRDKLKQIDLPKPTP
jgi:two-component system response regulator HydG